MINPNQMPQNIAGGQAAPQPQMPNISAPTMSPPPLPQSSNVSMQPPLQRMPSEVAGGAPNPPEKSPEEALQPPKLFGDWPQDHEGEHADLHFTQVGDMLRKVQQNPQAAQAIGQALQQHEAGGGKSTGDFRKDATLGYARIIAMLSQQGD